MLPIFQIKSEFWKKATFTWENRTSCLVGLKTHPTKAPRSEIELATSRLHSFIMSHALNHSAAETVNIIRDIIRNIIRAPLSISLITFLLYRCRSVVARSNGRRSPACWCPTWRATPSGRRRNYQTGSSRIACKLSSSWRWRATLYSVTSCCRAVCVSATVDVGGYLNLPVIKPDGKYTNVKYYSEGTTKLDRARSHAGAMLKVKSYALFHHKK